jgi:hypothetical protein
MPFATKLKDLNDKNAAKECFIIDLVSLYDLVGAKISN